jgi:DNA-binding NarL/FixJ family response regulator
VVNVIATLTLTEAMNGLVAGSSGFLLRQDAGPFNLCALVICAAGGSSVIPADLRQELVTCADSGRIELDEPTANGILSEREVEVLRLAGHGNETADIARLLSYSERTVKGIIHGVTSRLELRNRTHAVAWAVRHGLI